jgi:hypothetical protein
VTVATGRFDPAAAPPPFLYDFTPAMTAINKAGAST